MTTSRLEVRSDVMRGKPVIRGTRVPVELLLRRMADGATEDDLLESYPTLTRDDIRAAMSFAADPSDTDSQLCFGQAPRNVQ
jgi:uncharacterized protein (DUF433 family)